MSELQISLLIIGIFLVLAVQGYNLWQQRRYRRRYGAAFQRHGEDVLYRSASQMPSGTIPGETATGRASAAEPAQEGDRRRWPRECGLLGAATDYVAMLSFNGPVNAQVLAPLWKQRFDFRKNVYVCGLNTANGAWEKVVAESTLSYSAFKLALQLADRSGMVSETRLADFRDLARDIAAQQKAEAELPDVAEASARASELDGFCAEVDKIIGINILLGGERIIPGSEVARVAEQYGMTLQADGSFHLLDPRGYSVFSLGNYDNVPFQHHTLGQMWVSGLTLLLDVPRVEQPSQRFDEMVVLARQLAKDLHAALADDRRVALGDAGLAQIREQVAAIESSMLSGNIMPGSAQARRLFA